MVEINESDNNEQFKCETKCHQIISAIELRRLQISDYSLRVGIFYSSE